MSASCTLSLGPYCRGGSGSPGRPGGGPGKVQGGAAEVRVALRPPVVRETGDVLLLLLLEGPGASTGLPLPQHQPRVLLLLPAGEGRSVHLTLRESLLHSLLMYTAKVIFHQFGSPCLCFTHRSALMKRQRRALLSRNKCSLHVCLKSMNYNDEPEKNMWHKQNYSCRLILLTVSNSFHLFIWKTMTVWNIPQNNK